MRCHDRAQEDGNVFWLSGEGGGKLEITINQFVLVVLLLLDNDNSFDEESKVGCSWMFGMTICQRW